MSQNLSLLASNSLTNNFSALTMPVNKTETCSVNNEQEDTEENVDEGKSVHIYCQF